MPAGPSKYLVKADLLREVLLKSNYQLADALTTSSVMTVGGWKESLEPLLGVFLAYGCAEGLMRHFLAVEVADTRVSEELFRINSPSTKFMSMLFQSLGKDYLTYVLRPTVAESDENADKWDAENTLETHALEMCQRMLSDRLYGSSERVPKLLRELLHDVRETVTLRFPQQRLLSVGAFFILRFIAPALAAPVGAGITIAAPTASSTKALRTASGILQKLANGITTWKTPAEQAFFAHNHPLMLDLFEIVSSVEVSEQIPLDKPTVCVDSLLATLAELIWKHFDAIAKYAGTTGHSIDVQKLAAAVGISKKHALSAMSVSVTTDDGSSNAAVVMKPATPPAQSFWNSNPTGAAGGSASMFGASKDHERPKSPQQQQPLQKEKTHTFTCEAMKDLDAALEALSLSVKDFQETSTRAQEEELAKLRKAELENMILRAEISAICRKYNVNPSAPVQRLFNSSKTFVDGVECEERLANAQLRQLKEHTLKVPTTQQPSEMQESLSAETHKNLWQSIRSNLYLIRVRLDDPSDLNRTVYLGKTIKELYSYMQTPLDKRLEMKPIPRQWAAASLTPEKVAPLCLAAHKALDEIQRTVESLSVEAAPMLSLFEVDQRLQDIFAGFETLDDINSSSKK